MQQVQTRPKVFHYDVRTRWTERRRGVLAAQGKPALEVASPPEFKGHPGVWTPEDLLVAAVSACTMTTFLSFAERRDIGLVAYECDATGTLEMVEGKFRFSRVVLRPRIVVARQEDIPRALTAFHDAEAACLIANSLLTKVEGVPEIVARPANPPQEGGKP
jgi:organic hydroperoxide reductase OsmC/OhrA